MKGHDELTEAERDREVLRALVRKAKAGDIRARRYLGELLGIAKGRRVPSVEEIKRAAAAD